MKKNKNSYEVLEAEVAKLKEENRNLKDERDELKYMLNDMHSVVDAANDDFFNEMSRLCGCIEIEGTRITAAYKLLTVPGDTGYKNVTEKGRRTWNF